jgi:transposase-like protein
MSARGGPRGSDRSEAGRQSSNMRSGYLVEIVRRVADRVAAGYFPADDGVSMIAREASNNATLLRKVRRQLSEDPDTLPVCLSLLDRAAEMAARPPTALHVDRPDARRLHRGH